MNGTVQMNARAYKKFLHFALQHAHPNDARTNWQEVLAVLVGRFNDEKSSVEVTDVIPLAAGSSYHVEAHDYTKIFSVLSPERLKRGEFVVGWIHTHPGLGLFLSNTDVRTQSLYQRLDKRSIAIVCDPTKTTPNFPGMRAFRVIDVDDPFTSPLQELPISITDLEPRDFTEAQRVIARRLLAKRVIPLPPVTQLGKVVRRLYIGPEEMLRVVKLAKHQNHYVVNLQWICPHPNQDLTINVQLITTDVNHEAVPKEHRCFSEFCQQLGVESHNVQLRTRTPLPDEWPPALLLPVIPVATWTIPEELVDSVHVIISKGLKTHPPLIIT